MKNPILNKPILADSDTMIKIIFNVKFDEYEERTASINPKTKKRIQKWGRDIGFVNDKNLSVFIEKLQNKYKGINLNFN